MDLKISDRDGTALRLSRTEQPIRTSNNNCSDENGDPSVFSVIPCSSLALLNADWIEIFAANCTVCFFLSVYSVSSPRSSNPFPEHGSLNRRGDKHGKKRLSEDNSCWKEEEAQYSDLRDFSSPTPDDSEKFLLGTCLWFYVHLTCNERSFDRD